MPEEGRGVDKAVEEMVQAERKGSRPLLAVVLLCGVGLVSCNPAELPTQDQIISKETSFLIAAEAGNHPALIGDGLILTRNFTRLQDDYASGALARQAEHIPYPGNYWDYQHNGIAWRWQDPGYRPKAFDPEAEVALERRSPAEKYDLAHNQDLERRAALVELLGLESEYLATPYPAALWEYNHHGNGLTVNLYGLANEDPAAAIDGRTEAEYFLEHRAEARRRIPLLYDPATVGSLGAPAQRYLKVYYYQGDKVRTFELYPGEVEAVLVELTTRAMVIDEVRLAELASALGASVERYALTTKLTRPVIGWYGHCNGWVAASLAEEEPRQRVEVNGVPFEVGDQKALLAEVYYSAGATFAGNRNDEVGKPALVGGRADSDEEREAYDERRNPTYQTEAVVYRDVNPGTLYLVATNLIGYHGLPFAGDRQADHEIWNQPFFAYEILEQREITKERANQLLGVRADAPYPYNITSTRYAQVTMTLRYTNDYQVAPTTTPYLTPEDPRRLSVNDGALFKQKTYTFLLEMNDELEIEGGEWLGASRDDHPDFLWLTRHHGYDYKVIKSGKLFDAGVLGWGLLNLDTTVQDDFKTVTGGKLSFTRFNPKMELVAITLEDPQGRQLLRLADEELDGLVHFPSMGNLFLRTGRLRELVGDLDGVVYRVEFGARHDQTFTYAGHTFEFEVLDEDNPFIEYSPLHDMQQRNDHAIQE